MTHVTTSPFQNVSETESHTRHSGDAGQITSDLKLLTTLLIQ